MADFKIHCADCRRLLGEEFPQVHKWLDAYFMNPKYVTRHRKLRHNQAGIKAAKAKWGIRASWAAAIHIKRDLKEEGYDYVEYGIPKDRRAYEKLDLW